MMVSKLKVLMYQFFRQEFMNIFLDSEVIKEIKSDVEKEVWDDMRYTIEEIARDEIYSVKEVINKYDDEL